MIREFLKEIFGIGDFGTGEFERIPKSGAEIMADCFAEEMRDWRSFVSRLEEMVANGETKRDVYDMCNRKLMKGRLRFQRDDVSKISKIPDYQIEKFKFAFKSALDSKGRIQVYRFDEIIKEIGLPFSHYCRNKNEEIFQERGKVYVSVPVRSGGQD